MSGGLKKSLLALSVSSIFMASSAFATNGYFAHGYSTKEKGLAGAGVAYSQDSMAAATNPAGMVHVGTRMDIGAAVFNPNRSYTVTGGGTTTDGCNPAVVGACNFRIGPQGIDSDRKFFLIPHFGYNVMLDNSSSAGISVYGNGGMNTNYKGGTATFSPTGVNGGFSSFAGTFGNGAFGGSSTTGINLAQLFINGSYSKKLNADNSVGASLIFVYQMFSATGLAPLGGNSNAPTKLSDNGDDSSTGFGAKFGWQGTVASGVTLGASYQTKMSMSEFDDYAGLFAENGGFDIPATLILGAAWDVTPTSKVVLDVQTIYYSDIASISNGIAGLTSPTGCGQGQGDTSFCLGGSKGAGFGWDDMTVVKAGYEWMSGSMTYRAGISSGSQPIPDGETMFNILAPAVMETHLTFGFTMPLDATTEISFAGMYAPSNSVSGASPFDSNQIIKIEMDQFEAQATYSMKF